MQEAYVVDTLHLEPVKFPDYNTVYASLKTRQIDALNAGLDAVIADGTWSRPAIARRRPGQSHRNPHWPN